MTGIASGTRLGPYEISAKLGEGGMGVVYRARDTRLDRDVAIKVLPEAFTRDGDRLTRFEREAKLLAQLNHPNIAQVYGVEEAGDTRALVMELVEGPTLAERLAAGRIPIDEAIVIAHQIAEALEEAHEKGIVHRDLKPQNVKVTPEGKVKLLDFGLARALDASAALGAAPSASLAQSPTLTHAGTIHGVILGTAAYMSPEQAKGLAVDKRADVWSFGVVLFEMLAGKQLFAGDSATDMLAAVLRQEIPWAELPAGTPPALRLLLDRCLVRDRRQRLHDMGDARLELEAAAATAPATARIASGRRNADARAWAIAALAIVIGAGAAVWGWVAHRAAAPAAEQRSFLLSVSLPADVTLLPSGGDGGPVVVSPSGRQIAFSARRGEGPSQLWVRRLDEQEPRAVPGTEGAGHPFWSPDETSLGYFAQQQLRRIAIAGGSPTIVAPAVDARGGAWGPDGTILFTPNYIGPIQRVPAAGGPVRDATKLGKGEDTHRYPTFLPDGRHFLFLGRSPSWKGTLRIGSLDSLESEEVLGDVANAAYARGHLLFARAGALWMQPFDLGRRRVTGEARTLVDALMLDERYSLGIFAVSADGLLAYQTGKEVRLSRMSWLDRSGHRLGPAGDEGKSSGSDCPPALSSDGARVLTCRPNDAGTGNNVWLVDLGRSTSMMLSSADDDETSPIWMPQGDSLLYGTYGTDARAAQIFLRQRGQEARPLVTDPAASELRPATITPDGRTALIVRNLPDGAVQLYLLDIAGATRTLRPLLTGPAKYLEAQLSPDGHLLAYTSDETGRFEVFVQRFPAGGGKVRVSHGGAKGPRWRGDGRELYFWDNDNWVVASAIGEAGGELTVGQQARLFQSALTYYAVTRDGQRFLIEEWPSAGDVSPIMLRTGWDRPSAPSSPP